MARMFSIKSFIRSEFQYFVMQKKIGKNQPCLFCIIIRKVIKKLVISSLINNHFLFQVIISIVVRIKFELNYVSESI